ncbi:MAG: GldG family protein [Thermoanaerobaculales bacterium]|nr:GldG family protein [Thermoanaerobaculales bacterium]
MRQHGIRYTVTGVVAVILAVALTVMVNWLSARRWVREDLTSTKIYTLSEKSENILSDLPENIEVVVFMTPATSMYDQVRELLERYKAASDKISVEYIDPEREPLKTTQLAEKFGVQVADTVVFVLGDRTKYVTSDQMAEMDYSGMQYGQGPTMRAFKGEEQFTSAILSLVAPDVPKVYFVTSHGEAALEGGGGSGDRSLAVLGDTLKRENMEAADVSLLSGEVPADADVVAIVGPTRAYTESEITALETFLDRGGRLLVALDPLIEPAGTMRPTRLEEMLAARGVIVNDDLVVDPSRRLPFYDLSAVYLQDFPSHPVTSGLEGFAVLFTVARSLTADDGAAQALVQTSDEGWGETNLGMLLRGEPVALYEGDTAGPAVVAVAVEGAATGAEAGAEGLSEPTTYRLVVFGDSDFMTDLDIANAGNAVLAGNAFNWLAARDSLVGIPPRDVEQVSLFLTQQQMRNLLLLVLVGMPCAAILLGVLVWRKRRH